MLLSCSLREFHFGTTRVKSRFGAIQRGYIRGAWRKPEPRPESEWALVGHSPSKSGEPAGSYPNFPPRILPFSRLPKMRKRDNRASGRSANGGADSRTISPLGILSCARITRIRSGECLSITGYCRHVSISIHSCHATRYARVPVRQTWTSIDVSSHPRPRNGPLRLQVAENDTRMLRSWSIHVQIYKRHASAFRKKCIFLFLLIFLIN